MDTIKADAAIQAGDVGRIVTLVDTKIMPHVNFSRMTVFGRRVASGARRHPSSRQALQAEFKLLLVRTYAGALGEVKDQSLSFQPTRFRPEDTDVVVRSVVRGRGEPIQLDYRLEKTGEWLEDLRPERAGYLAGGHLPQPVRPGNQQQGSSTD